MARKPHLPEEAPEIQAEMATTAKARLRSKAVSIKALPRCRTIRYPTTWEDSKCVEAYNKAVGIISTMHKHEILASDEAPDYDASPAKAPAPAT